MPTAGQILKAFDSQLKQDMIKYKAELAEFGSKLANPKSHFEPAHEYDFGDGYVSRAAYLKVCGIVLTALRNMPTSRHPTTPLTTDERLERITAVVERELLNNARSVSKSTSACANLIHHYETACWAELLENLHDPWNIRGVW